MKLIVVTKEKKIYEIDKVEFFNYDTTSKVLQYFSQYKFYDVAGVEIMSCKEDT